MSWVARESASAHDSINSWDSIAGAAGTYSGSTSLGCNSEMVVLLATIKGAVAFVQGAAEASSGNVSDLALAFPGNNTAGNTLIVDCGWGGIIAPQAHAITISDTQGNAYITTPAVGGGTVRQGVAGGNTLGVMFVALNCKAGANTVMVTIDGGSTSTSATLAIHEYAGGSSVDGDLSFDTSTHQSNSGTGVNVGGGAATATQTTTAPADLLHFTAFISGACNGSPSNPGGGGTNPPVPPAITGGTPTPTQPFFANLPPPPLQTPIVDVNSQQSNVPYPLKGIPSGDLTNPWAGWFNAVYQFLEALGLAGGSGSLGATTITASTTLASPTSPQPYTGQILALNSATAQTLTLPSAPPSGIWNLFVQNIGIGTWTLSPNGLLIDASGASLTLATGQGLYISTDGVNYFTMRGDGVNLLETNGTPNSSQRLLNLVAGLGVTLTDEGSGSIQIAASPGSILPTAKKYTASWSAQTSVTVTHNLGTSAVLVQVQDASGNVVVPQNIAITSANVVTLTFGANFTGSVTVIGFGAPSAPEFNETFAAATSVTVTHNLNTTNVFVMVYDGSGNQVIPQGIAVTSANVVTLTFGAAFAGSVVVVGLPVAVQQFDASWTSQTSVTITHNLNTTAVIVQVYDNASPPNQVIPQQITATSSTVVTLTFGASFTGSAVVIG
jgi:hypothetical protein